MSEGVDTDKAGGVSEGGSGEEVLVDIDDVGKFDNAEGCPAGHGPTEDGPKVTVMGHDREKGQRSRDVLVEKQYADFDFQDMQLNDSIIKGLRICRYDKPTPIQLRAIPLGKLNYDLLLQAKSGTGKTCVFTVCILQQIAVTDVNIQALVIAPCREIAFQISNVTKSIGAFIDGLKVKEFIGGTAVTQSIRRLTNCHVAVGTPGRLAHMIKDYNMDLSRVNVVALDEADKLMDPSFFDDIKVIFKALPARKQMIATSATYSDIVVQFLQKFMKNAVKIQLDLDNPALCAVDQYIVDARLINKRRPFKRNAQAQGSEELDEGFQIKMDCLKEIMRRISYKQAIVFSNYQLRAEKIYETLKFDVGWDVDLLSASRSQEDRLLAYMALQNGKIKALVATDVAARGIDIEGVDLVINFDIPNDQDTYIHRVGRTGRFGSCGRALSICFFDTDRQQLAKYQSKTHSTLWIIKDVDEIQGINDSNSHQRSNLRLKAEDEPEVQMDPEEQTAWKEKVEAILNRRLEDDCLANYYEESGWRPTISYDEVADEYDKMMADMDKRLAIQKQKRIAMANAKTSGVDEQVPDEVEFEDDKDLFSSDEEIEEDEDEHIAETANTVTPNAT